MLGGGEEGQRYQSKFCEGRLRVERSHSVDRIEIHVCMFFRATFNDRKGANQTKFY